MHILGLIFFIFDMPIAGNVSFPKIYSLWGFIPFLRAEMDKNRVFDVILAYAGPNIGVV